MMIRRILSLMVAMLLVLGIGAIAFAEAPNAEAPTGFTIEGWNNAGEGGESAVKSVSVNGQTVAAAGSSLVFDAGEEITVEIELEDGYELVEWDDEIMLRLDDDVTGMINIANSRSSTTITTPSSDALSEHPVLVITFWVSELTEPDEPSIRVVPITSLELTAPKIKEGEGYTYDEARDEYLPLPAVTIPGNANYKFYEYMDLEGNIYPDIFWLVEDPDGYLGFEWPSEDAVFKKGEWYYIALYLEPKNGDSPDIPMPRAADSDIVLYYFEDELDITVKNGELVTYKVYNYDYDYYVDSEVLVILKVTPDNPSPNTRDINVLPWVLAAIISVSFLITYLDEEKRRA